MIDLNNRRVDKMKLATTQNGDKEIIEGKSIIKELLAKFGYNTASKMYIDTKDGNTKHIGYVLASRGFNPLWVTLYNISDWKKGA